MHGNVIFLDIDGVLNNVDSAVRYKTTEKLDIHSVSVLKAISKEHRANIVISSTWRLGLNWREYISSAFRQAKWDSPPIIDRTPTLGDGPRGFEIEAWLQKNRTMNFVILDDEDDMLPEQIRHFVQTDFSEGGLKEEHADLVREIFTR